MGKIPTDIKVAIPILLFGLRCMAYSSLGIGLMVLMMIFPAGYKSLEGIILFGGIFLVPAALDGLTSIFLAMERSWAKWLAAVVLVLGMAPILLWALLLLNTMSINYKYGVIDEYNNGLFSQFIFLIFIMVAFAAPIIYFLFVDKDVKRFFAEKNQKAGSK